MSKLTLEQFVTTSKKENCLACKLPAAIKKQIRERKDDVNLATVSIWLKSLGHRVSEHQLAGHFRSGHDRGK